MSELEIVASFIHWLVLQQTYSPTLRKLLMNEIISDYDYTEGFRGTICLAMLLISNRYSILVLEYSLFN
jgi:hypothetical protein